MLLDPCEDITQKYIRQLIDAFLLLDDVRQYRVELFKKLLPLPRLSK